MKIVIVSGFWDPIGCHHLKLFKQAKKLGDYLIVGVNSDECSERKKKQPSFMPYEIRADLCRNIKCVDQVVGFEDSDGTACQLLHNIYTLHKDGVDKGDIKLYFANGGSDRVEGESTPEEKYINDNLKGKVAMVYGVGGENKSGSSSEYLRNWVNNTMIKYGIDFKLEDKY